MTRRVDGGALFAEAATALARRGLGDPRAVTVTAQALVLHRVLDDLTRQLGRPTPAGRLAALVAPWEAAAPRGDVADAAVAELLSDVRREGADEPASALAAVFEWVVRHEVTDIAAGSLRRRLGRHPTPQALVREAVGQALRGLGGAPARVCDPAAGAGAFLLEVARRRLDAAPAARAAASLAGLVAIDVDPLAVATCQAVLWLAVTARGARVAPDELPVTLLEGDALLGPAPSEVSDEFLPALGARLAAAPGAPGPAAAFQRADVVRRRRTAEARLGAATAAEREALAASARRAGALPLEALLPDGATGFDLVLGNPPWVAWAGRAAQPLAPALRAEWAARYAAFRGYRTLHGLFVERAAALAPNGRVALLLPSSLADLAGYAPVREVLARTHEVREPLLELGEDAFASVVQPALLLVADARRRGRAVMSDAARPWRLRERSSRVSDAELVALSEELRRVASGAALPPALFGELGFQSNPRARARLLHRATAPPSPTHVALLEGRDVTPFRQGAPRLYLDASPEALRAVGVRLASPERFAAVALVVRQTAEVPIAARHGGAAFRNSLLAVYADPDHDADLLLGLLNSSLYRALHLGSHRDGRQRTFPQLKLGQLRSLPAPPPSSTAGAVRAAARALEADPTSPELRRRLDAAVADLFALSDSARAECAALLRRRAPRFAPP